MCERTFTGYLIIVGIYISPQFWTFDSINFTLQGRQMSLPTLVLKDEVVFLLQHVQTDTQTHGTKIHTRNRGCGRRG